MADVVMSDASDNVRVFAFSPLAVDACFSELWNYATSIALVQQETTSEHSPDKLMQRRLQAAKQLPLGVLRAAAGSGEDREALQEIIEGSGLTIPENVGANDVVAVSNLKYVFRWPMEMRVQLRNDIPNAFQLKHAEDCFLVRALAQKGFDGLVVYVEKKSNYNISVMFVGIPSALPTDLLQVENREGLRRELMKTHALIVSNAASNRNSTPPAELGVATLCKFKNKAAMDLEEIKRMTLPGGKKIDIAQHVCQLGMDEGGGFVQAASLMISKGIRMSVQRPVDIDFRKFPNGYLAFVEMTDNSSTADVSPTCLAAAWINMPDSIQYE